MKRMSLLLIGLLLLSFTAAAAAFKDIGAEELKKMMDAKKQLTVVDTRTAQEFAQGHIPGAINIPPEKVNGIDTLLPKNKTVSVVFYCRGAG